MSMLRTERLLENQTVSIEQHFHNDEIYREQFIIQLLLFLFESFFNYKTFDKNFIAFLRKIDVETIRNRLSDDINYRFNQMHLEYASLVQKCYEFYVLDDLIKHVNIFLRLYFEDTSICLTQKFIKIIDEKALKETLEIKKKNADAEKRYSPK